MCVHVLNQLLDKNQNKIASIQPTPRKNGEVAEFQSLLRGHNLTV